ncbi:cytochrome P450 71B2-like [Papaver somniferum]|uniref:cytochrome P450 71B2-like n=1 Tax=Papaver somniferum TaxID=3469 RepID=UPI000E6FFA12|nr:cytochrome P450 71B2-like [Papaver somniferum]
MSSWFLFFPFFVALLICILIKKRCNTKHAILHPPGPCKLPFIGNCLHLLFHGLPHRCLWHLSKKHGPIMYLQLGRLPVLVISSAELAKEVLKTNDRNFSSRPSLACPGKFSYNSMDVTFSSYNEYWKEMRKIFVFELLNPKRVVYFRSIRVEEVAFMIHSISQSSCKPMDLSEQLLSLTFTIICRIAFGREFDKIRFQRIVYQCMETIGSYFAADLFPFFGCIIDVLTGQHSKLKKNFHKLDNFLQQVIDQHIDSDQRRPNSQQDDTLDILLGLEKRGVGDVGPIQISKDRIKALLMNIFVGGVGTSTTTMVWAMTELVKNPRIMKKAQDEVRNCVGKQGKVEETDLDQLHYLKMVLKETLRLHPPGPMSIPRESIRHCKIKNYDILPKTTVLINAWAIGRDPGSWDDPEVFLPERFMTNSIDFRGQHFEFLPFGSGRRGCPGISLATTIMELTLANLLYSFNWEIPYGLRPENMNMDEAGTFAVHKKSALELVPIMYQGRS